MKKRYNSSAQSNKYYYLIKQNTTKISVLIIAILATCFLNSCIPNDYVVKTNHNIGKEIAQNEKIENVKIITVKDIRKIPKEKWLGFGSGPALIFLDTSLSIYIKESLNNLICKDTSINPSINVSIEIDKFLITEVVKSVREGNSDFRRSYLYLEFQYTFYFEKNGIPKKVIFKDIINTYDDQDYRFDSNVDKLVEIHTVKLALAFIKKFNEDIYFTKTIANPKFNYENDKLASKNMGIQADTVDMHVYSKWDKKGDFEFEFYNSNITESGYAFSVLLLYKLPVSLWEYGIGLSFHAGNIRPDISSGKLLTMNLPFKLKYYFSEPFFMVATISPGLAMLDSQNSSFFGSRLELGLGYNWTAGLSTHIGAYGHNYIGLKELPKEVGLVFGLNLSFPIKRN